MYESLFRGSPVANYLLSPTPEATILAVNDAFLKASSRLREDLVGRSLFAAFPGNPDDPEDTGEAVLRNSLARVIATREPDALPAQRYPIRITTPEGEERYEERFWSAVNTPIFDEDGQLLCISHTTTDVTKEVQAEAALRKSEAQYRDLFNSLTEGFCVVEVLFDERGRAIDYRFCETNPAFQAQTGLHDAVGKRMCTMAPQHETHWFDLYGQVARTGEPIRFESEAKALGRWFDVYAFRTDEPAAHKVAILSRDITARKSAEKALYEQSEELKLALRVGRSGTFQWDAKTHEHRWLNEMFPLYGLKPGEFGGTDADWLACLLPEDRKATMAAVERSLQTGEYSAEFRIRRRDDGAVRWISGRGQVFFDADGRPARMFGINVDVTEQRHVLAELEASKARLEAVLDSLKEGVVIFDLGGQVVNANPAAAEIMGYGAPAHVHRKLPDFPATFDVFALDGRPLPLEEWPIGRVIRGESFTDFELLLRRKDNGSVKILSHNGARVRSVGGEAILGVVTLMDVSDRKRAEQQAREAALHDPLTGLPNRALVFEYGSHLLAAARRVQGHVALLFIDLDRFKPINDLYGHEIGDRVLQEVGRRLVDCTRHEDLTGRMGGDEFLIILPHLDAAPHRAAVVAQHVVTRLNQPIGIDELELSLSCSIGISYYPEHGGDVGTLIHTADLAMYQAKQSGRDGFQFYTPELDASSNEAHSLEASLKHALKHEGLRLHYQPVIDIASGQMTGAEALLRLSDGDGGMVSPERFIPIAESAGLIGELGQWVVREACRQHEAWLDDGLDVAIAVNVSPIQFRQRDFAERLAQILAETGAAPAALQVEITESAVMERLEDAIEILKAIRSLGVKVALDDFGTGHSSLSSLSLLPLDKLKVDQSFVRRIGNDQASRSVIEAIIALGRSLRLVVVGEGIESEDALRYLQAHGCNQAQGYFFSHPLPAREFAQWYRQRQLH